MATDPHDLKMQTTQELLQSRFADEKKKPGRPKKDVGVAKSVEVKESELFRESLLVVMNAYQVKSARDLRACVPVAEEYIKVFKERYQ